MASINLTKELEGSVEGTVERLGKALQQKGFGVLTRIDFHAKIKEKLGKTIPATVILGACNPTMAFEAYSRNAEVTAVMPCNAVVREVGQSRVTVELARPTELMRIFDDKELIGLAKQADGLLAEVLAAL